MSIPISTPSQNEFAQIFERLASDFKMTKADVARALLIKKPYFTMILKGQRKPGIRLLGTARGLEKRLRSGDRDGLAEDGELSRVFEQLKTLKEIDPTAFQAVKQVVETLAGTSSKSKTTKSIKGVRVK